MIMVFTQKYQLLFVCLFGLGLLSHCQVAETTSLSIESSIGDFKKNNKIDSRLLFYNVKAELQQSKVVLKGDLDSEINKSDFIAYLSKNHPNLSIVDSIYSLRPIAQKLVNVSVCNVRSKPKHSAELSTQHLMGYPVIIYKISNGWNLTKGPDGYIGWINSSSLVDYNQAEWSMDELGFINCQETVGRYQNQIVTDLVFGNIVKIIDQSKNAKCLVELPDARLAEIQNTDIIPLSTLSSTVSIDANEYLQSAFAFMGRPYLWGGTSPKGMDCSGFTRTSMLGQGVIIGRDASLQALQGKEVDPGVGYSSLKKGDLLFFGTLRSDGSKRVTHVAFHLAEGRFIHESGQVKVESLNPDHDDYNQDRANTFLMARRIDMSSLDDLIQIKDLF